MNFETPVDAMNKVKLKCFFQCDHDYASQPGTLYIQVVLLFQPARQLAYISFSDHMAHLNETYHFMDPQVLVCVDLFPYGSSGLCLCRPIPLRVFRSLFV